MPSDALIDFEKVDLGTVIASREQVYSRLAQQGRFALLDGVLLADGPNGVIVGFKEIRADDWWAPDHVPGRPLFPGVLMCEAAAQLCSYDYLRKGTIPPGTFLGFGGMDETRFRGMVEPPNRLVIVAKAEKLRSRAFTYSAQGFVERQLVFETRIIGVLV